MNKGYKREETFLSIATTVISKHYSSATLSKSSIKCCWGRIDSFGPNE